MQIKSQKNPAFEEDGNYARKLDMIIARDTKTLRKSKDTINDNKTQQQDKRKNAYLFSMI